MMWERVIDNFFRQKLDWFEQSVIKGRIPKLGSEGRPAADGVGEELVPGEGGGGLDDGDVEGREGAVEDPLEPCVRDLRRPWRGVLPQIVGPGQLQQKRFGG